jgi:hypothetical protein
MSTTPQEIARGLKKAQREAILGRFGWNSPWAQEDGERDLETMGLWNPRHIRFKSVLTPLGFAVRAILTEGTHDNAD